MTLVLQEGQGLREGIQAGGSLLGSILQQRQQGQANALQERGQTVLMNTLAQFEGNVQHPDFIGTLNTALQEGKIPFKTVAPFVDKFLSEQVKAKKEAPLSDLQKGINKSVTDTILGLPKVADARRSIETLKELSKRLEGPQGVAKALFGSSDATELNALGLTAIQPALEILNPRGALPTRKIEMIKEQYAPNALDTRWKMEGKIKALESFTENAERLGAKMVALQRQFGDNIPIEAIIDYESQAAQLLDDNLEERGKSDIDGDNIPDDLSYNKPSLELARKNKGRILTNQETGEKMQSNGTRWVKYKG